MNTSTNDNLKEAFAGESMANRKYLAFAKKADEEGLKQVARLFRAAAAAETVHAHNHLGVLGDIKSTEFKEMYPAYIEEAKKEGNKDAAWSFNLANQVEQIHAGLYKKALENLGSNEEVDYYVCKVCGNTVENEPSGKCPICGAPASEFEKVESTTPP